MAITNKTRLDRLKRLRDIVELHKGQRGKPVQLNGVSRSWDMYEWGCDTSACALGSYILTPYGRKYFVFDDLGEPVLKDDSREGPIGSASKHFDLTEDEVEWLFMPRHYGIYDNEASIYDIKASIPPSRVIKRIDFLIKRYSD